MHVQQNSRYRPVRKSLISSVLTLLFPIAVGCASPGNPRPPTLNLAEIVTDLKAERTGNQVQLQWTTPSRTTDGIEVKGTLTAEVCRQTTSASCTPIQRLAVMPGPTQAIDPLTSTLIADPATLLVYRVVIFNAAGRTAGPSAQAFAAAGTAPPPIARLKATASRDGAVIEWLNQSNDSLVTSKVELDRVLVKPPASNTLAKPAPASLQSLKFVSPRPGEVFLQTEDAPGGTLDRTAQKGETYRYTAQRVRSIELDGHALELRSLKTIPVIMLLRDTFPPAVPTGLAAVPGGADSIDLSWEPNSEADLAGYLVYRQEITADGKAQGPFARLSASPVLGPAFHDSTATPGRSYRYRITSIDTTGNESAPGADVRETPREQ